MADDVKNYVGTDGKPPGKGKGGRPKKDPKDKALLSVYIDKVDYSVLERIAELEARTVSQQARYILMKWAKQYLEDNYVDPPGAELPRNKPNLP